MFIFMFTSCVTVTGPVAPEVDHNNLVEESHSPAVENDYEELGSNELVILHTNDLHGHFLPERAGWIDGEPTIGGFIAIDNYVSQVEARFGESNVLLFDGGDILTGTPLTDMVVRGSQGGAMMEFMEAVGYDAWVLGNHEFDKGFDNIAHLVADSQIPVLSSNVRGLEEGSLAMDGLQASVVLSAGELRVGVIGATTMGLGHLASAETMSNIILADISGTVADEIGRLDEVTDLLVVLSHIGLESDQWLAENVSGIDLIVGGHSHTHLDEPINVNGTWIVQAGSYGRSIGELRITVESDQIVAFTGVLNDLPEVNADDFSDVVETEVGRLTEQYRLAIESEYGQVVGEASGAFGRSYNHESSLGMWVTDVLREKMETDIGLYNAGGIRSDIVEGPLTPNDIFNVFPFSNQVVTFEISGAELMGMLVQNAHAAAFEDRGAIQMSGVEVVWAMRMGSPEIVSARVGDAPIDPERVYTIATNSYMHDQAERYLAGANPENLIPSGTTVFEVVMERVRDGVIDPPTDLRFVRQQQ
jgi:5'-nucleotidase / UDP-sugar diphosphatase